MQDFSKLPKGNLIFITDPKVKEFIKYCESVYSHKIEKINIFLNQEHNDWQMSVEEASPGAVWLPWFIPTSSEGIVEGGENLSLKNILKSKYKVCEETKKPSSLWITEYAYDVTEPDGWDRENYEYSWNIEEITKTEFERRLTKSTLYYRKKI